jgi:methionyl-tRNA formyltransferase
MNSFVLFLMGKKGLSCLEAVLSIPENNLKKIVFATDKSVENDYSSDIILLCNKYNIPCHNKNDFNYDELNDVDYFIAISWRWLINDESNKLIVLHDSILPKYRGFNPLVSALINGENEIGVTAIFANKEFDRGDIIDCKKTSINYPIKIEEAINKISICYQELLIDVIKKILNQTIQTTPQNDNEASYSLWRDEEDYFIDWNLDSNTIERTINALGFPYTGAKTTIEKQTIILSEVKAIEDINIVNRKPGKVIFMEEGNPIIVCGKGLLKIIEMKSLDSKVIQLSKFRTRLK